MEKLLKWSVDATHSGKIEGEPDPKLLAQLFGAPDDQTQMKEALKAAVHSTDRRERIECLEAFEEHVENADNANNIGALWQPLLFLTGDADAEIRALALSGVAAAVQNNEKAQNDLVATKNGIQAIMERVNDADDTVAAKALFALSAAIGHNPGAYDQFVHARGWNLFETVFSKSFDTAAPRPEKIRGRVLSLLYAVVLVAPHKPVHDEIERLGLVPKLKELREREAEPIQDKIDHILAFLAATPRPQPKEVKLLAA